MFDRLCRLGGFCAVLALGSMHLCEATQALQHSVVNTFQSLRVYQHLARGSFTLDNLIDACREFWEIFGPGGKLHPAYFIEHQGHLFIEGALLAAILYLLFQRSFKPRHREERLTEKEVDQLCAEWQPEPICPEVPEHDSMAPPPVLDGIASSKTVTVAGRPALNLATANFLGMSQQQLGTPAAEAIAKYGVGSCGPRGFYGTFDVHLQLEKDLARFMGAEECIIYSYDLATISSVIPAFASKKDILVVDEHVGYPIQKGCSLARSRVFYFKHNDMADLERVLRAVDVLERKERRPLTRRWIIVEGIYANYGDIAPLDAIYQLKEKYKWRLMVEESFSFGVLGATGRGACQHFGLQPSQVEVICASTSTALASIGGFCVGDHDMVDHQRLSGAGYIFSASLPPYLAVAAIHSLHLMGRDVEGAARRVLHANARQLRAGLKEIRGLQVGGVDDICPLVYVHLAASSTRREAYLKLQALADLLLREHGVLVTVSRYSNLERVLPPISLKMYVTAELTSSDVSHVIQSVRAAAAKVISK